MSKTVKHVNKRSSFVSNSQAFEVGKLAPPHISALSSIASQTHRILSLKNFKERYTLCKAAVQIEGSDGPGAQHREQRGTGCQGLSTPCQMWLVPFCLPVAGWICTVLLAVSQSLCVVWE